MIIYSVSLENVKNLQFIIFRMTNCSNFKHFWELYPYSYILCIVSNFRYTCNNNFKIKGTVSDTQATIQCQSDSTWGTLPECVSK